MNFKFEEFDLRMARYDYRCSACGTIFEVEHPMRENPEICCPACGAHADRMFNASAIVLNGSGFYNTDQRGKSGKAGSKAPTSGGAATCATSGVSEHCEHCDKATSAK